MSTPTLDQIAMRLIGTGAEVHIEAERIIAEFMADTARRWPRAPVEAGRAYGTAMVAEAVRRANARWAAGGGGRAN
jgi:hypothetical protein